MGDTSTPACHFSPDRYAPTVPSPLPRSVPTGTDHYYMDRLADFAARCPDATPPSYYEDYGDKCLHQFRRTEPHLTAEGQRWLQRTLVDLQDRLEHRRAGDPAGFGRLETDSDAFGKMAFEMHSDAYLDSGISELPVSDLFRIANTPDVADLVTPEGLEQLLEVISGMETDGGRSAPRRALNAVLQGLNRLRGS